MSTESGVTVILADGDYPSTKNPLDALHNAETIVCCDGAAAALIEHGIIPDKIVGDMDSLSAELKERFGDRIIHFSEQENNDLTKAFNVCLAAGCKKIIILGATGKREDHSLGNLSLLVDYAEKIPDIKLITDYGEFFVALKSGTFPCSPGEKLSFFAVDPDTRVTSGGLKFPMNSLLLNRWWRATLNEAEGDSFSLSFPEGCRLLIYRAF
jgi:thiamine pyrophosphokinase